MIYFDYSATTPLDPKVLDAMMPFLTKHYGNASNGLHSFGKLANNAIERARKQVNHAISGQGEQCITFTSGATESLNIAIKGVFENYQTKGNHIILCATEHPAVRNTAEFLQKQGAEISYLSVNQNGDINLDELKGLIKKETILVAVAHINNEIGTTHPIEEIGRICRTNNTLFLCDATQSIGKTKVDAQAKNIDILVGSGHKIYGPKGVGFIYTNRKQPRVQLPAQMHGGMQEEGKRAGTYNVPGIVGLGEAIQLANTSLEEVTEHVAILNKEIIDELKKVGGVIIQSVNPTPFIINVAFPNADSNFITELSKDVAISVGAACSTGNGKPSYVLKQLGIEEDLIKKSIRISIGKSSTREEALTLIKKIISIY